MKNMEINIILVSGFELENWDNKSIKKRKFDKIKSDEILLSMMQDQYGNYVLKNL